jgi:hypothetical protein
MSKHQDSEQHTVPEDPPIDARPARRPSKWATLFDECRAQPGIWRRTRQSFSPPTAAQLASDIRSAWRRNPERFRLTGLRAGEYWEAVWGPAPGSDDKNKCFIWLRYIDEKRSKGHAVEVDGIEYAW